MLQYHRRYSVMNERDQLKGLLLNRLGQAAAIVKFASSPQCPAKLREPLLSRFEDVDIRLLQKVEEAQRTN